MRSAVHESGERVITDQIPVAVTSSPYQGIGAFYEGLGGVDVSPCRAPAVLISMTPGNALWSAVSAVLTENASQEGTCHLGPFGPHSLTHKGWQRNGGGEAMEE